MKMGLLKIYGKCFICLKETDLEQCPKCLLYMCKRHKTVHRNQEGDCYPYKVELRGSQGRILVATRNIRRGELICRESPAIVGPYSRTSPQCLQCFKIFPPGHTYTCEACGFPVCDVICSKGRYHQEECEILKAAGVKVKVDNLEDIDTQYSAVAVLRLLLLMKREKEAVKNDSNTDGDDGEYLLCLSEALMDHNSDRRLAQKEVWQFEEEFMVKFLLDTCGLRDTWTPEEVHAAHGRILMNATSLEFPETGEYGRGAGLYPIYSMMNTWCKNNTVSKVMEDYTVEIRAKTRIRKGEEISNQYMVPDTPAYIRRPVMKEKWFFDCSCPRCLDPTELGSYFGSILCDNRKCGGPVISSDPSNNLSDFHCQKCGKTMSYATVMSVISTSEKMILNNDTKDGVIEHYERILDKLSSLLHPGNYLLLELKQKLGLLYGNIFPHTINRMKRPARDRKVQLCYDVIKQLSKIESGMSEWRIVMMTELAKMTQDGGYLEDNPDPDGRRGMMARFLLNDGMLTLTNCLQLCK